MVQFYNARLTEREKRRDFLRARGLLNMKRMQVLDHGISSTSCSETCLIACMVKMLLTLCNLA